MERRGLIKAIVAAGVASSPPLSGLARAEPQSQRRAAMSNANEVVVRYLAAWNEPEPRRRRDLVAKAWADDGSYVDAAREAAAMTVSTR